MISYIPGSIRKDVGGLNEKVISIFKIDTHTQTVYGRGNKRPSTQNLIS